TSPLLDIQQGLRELTNTKKVIVVSVNNECKELLFLCEKNFMGDAQIEAVDLFANGDIKNTFSFFPQEEKNANSLLGEAAKYLYEPNASILKAGAFKLISEKFQLIKLAANTHLYTANHLMADFPGRIFQVESLDPDTKQLKSLLPNGKANVLTRNYPLKPEELKKKLKLTDGGEKYVIGFSSQKKKHLAILSLPIKTR
ncbi:MAG: class I SAM-dependent methyltransferase, partial [Cyclobacteriaceae bacterium]|nr:class I SAM-dependent methyltransferase [Cyclobacteriaceae bacterium]